MTRPGPIRAAGVVLYDADDRIAVVHRPRRGDWSLPKGKLEPGEPHLLAALRECHEETGQRARLEAPLPSRSYEVDGVPKVVRYWRAQVTSDDGFVPGDEVDDLRWVGADEAAALLTYADDVDLVVRSGALGPSRPLVVLRHAEAVKRAAWRATSAGSDDAARPLTPLGLVQADAVADVLAAYGIGQVVTSPSRRCRQTVEPYADRAELGLELEPALSEEDHDTDPTATRSAVRSAASAPGRTALCTHRPVLPTVLRTLADALQESGGLPIPLDRRLAPAGALVVHRGAEGRVVAVEHHAG